MAIMGPVRRKVRREHTPEPDRRLRLNSLPLRCSASILDVISYFVNQALREFGRHPVGDREINLIEQVNQNLTDFVCPFRALPLSRIRRPCLKRKDALNSAGEQKDSSTTNRVEYREKNNRKSNAVQT